MMIFKIPLEINGKLGFNKIYAGTHWSIRKKDKEYILNTVFSVLGKRKTLDYPVDLKMLFNSKLDVSNHAYLFKMVEDSLVSCGLLKDDTDKYVKTNILGKQKEFKGIIVTLEKSEY